MNPNAKMSVEDDGYNFFQFRPILPFFGQKIMVENIFVWVLKRRTLTEETQWYNEKII